MKYLNLSFKILFTSLIMTIGLKHLNAQSPKFEWAYSLSSAGLDHASKVKVNKAGDVFVLSLYTGTVDLDPDPVTQLNFTSTIQAIALQKLSPAGKLLWAIDFKGTGSIAGMDIDFDQKENIYILGHFLGEADFDPSSGTEILKAQGTTNDMFIVKLDPTGKLIWAKSEPSSLDHYGGALTIRNESVYISSRFSGTTDFDPDPTKTENRSSAGSFDIAVQKLNTDGKFIWVKTMGAVGDDQALDIAVDKEENVYATGWFQNTVDFNSDAPGTNVLVSGGHYDAFLLKLNTDGKFIWVNQVYGSPSPEQNYSVRVDSEDNIYVAGHFSSATNSFNHIDGSKQGSLKLRGSYDIYVYKIHKDGKVIWEKSMGGAGDDRFPTMTIDGKGNVFVSAYFSSTANLMSDPDVKNVVSKGSYDIFVVKLDSDGKFVWGESFGSTGQERPVGNIFATDKGEIYLTGRYQGTVDVDPDPSATYELKNAGNFDGYVIKWNEGALPCKPSTATIKVEECGIYTFNKKNYTKSGTFVDTLKNGNLAGCDSIVTIVLNINTYPTRTITAATCNSYSFNNKTYSKSGNYTDTVIYKHLPGVCDSIITLNLTINSYPTRTVTIAACDSYTSYGKTRTISGTYRDTVGFIHTTSTCDSIVILNLTINKSKSSSLTTTVCSSYSFNGKTYNSSGKYLETFKSSAGCDSVVTLNLTINQPTSNTITTSVCDEFSFNNKTYKVSGRYFDTIPNAQNCDSVITFNLTIHKSSIDTIKESACGSYQLGDSVYLETGIYTKIFTNSDACDSTVTVNLTVNKLDLSVSVIGKQLIAANGPFSYQWLDCDKGNSIIPNATNQIYMPIVEGNFSVIVTLNDCSDTSACYYYMGDKVNIENRDFGQSIILFPNPNKGLLNLKSGVQLQNATITIFNILGQKILSNTKLNGNHFSFNIQEYASGIYYLEIKEGAYVKIIRFVKD